MTEIEKVMMRAKARMLAAPLGLSQAEIDYMSQEELTTWNEWRLYLPSAGQQREEARARLKEKIEARK